MDHIAAQTAHRIFINYIRTWTMKKTECRSAEIEGESVSICLHLRVCLPLCACVQVRVSLPVLVAVDLETSAYVCVHVCVPMPYVSVFSE